MSRKTDTELLDEIKKRREESEEDEDEDEEPRRMTRSKTQKVDKEEEINQQPQIIEREVNLTLINEKLNFIISKLFN